MEALDEGSLSAELKQKLEEGRIAVDNLRTITLKLEEVNEKLRLSEAMRSNFLANVRNEINNPLAAILGLTRQIADRKADAETASALATAAYREAFDLDFQLRNVFAAAELEAGEASMSTARLDVLALLRQLRADLAHRAGEKRVTVEIDGSTTGGGQLHFTTDPEKLRCILANLLANAMEFTKAGTQVSVSARREGRSLVVAVSDQGPGVAPADRKRVFDRFVQLDTGTRKRNRGHGLGLSIVKAYAEMLGGTISLSSEERGGCVFTLSVAGQSPPGPVDTGSGDGGAILFSGTEPGS
jgi:signal transduction histidine kinase